MTVERVVKESQPDHGTRARYQGSRTRARCRCDACCLANTEYMREHRYGGTAADHPPAQHGSRTMYNKGCRCADCTEANREYQREWMRENRW